MVATVLQETVHLEAAMLNLIVVLLFGCTWMHKNDLSLLCSFYSHQH